MNWSAVALLTLLCSVEAFTAPSSLTPTILSVANAASSLHLAKGKGEADAPPLRSKPPRNICLMVEPTPFTHVSGYANRFQEMLKFLKKAGDNVDILTVDSKTPAHDLPTSFMGFPIEHTLGFTFPLYNQISLTFDLPEAKGAAIIERRKPDLIHVTSPYVYYLLCFIDYSSTLYYVSAPRFGVRVCSWNSGFNVYRVCVVWLICFASTLHLSARHHLSLSFPHVCHFGHEQWLLGIRCHSIRPHQ